MYDKKEVNISTLPFQAMFEKVTDAIFIIDPQGNVISTNSAAEKLTGWTIEELKLIPFCGICQGVATNQEDSTCQTCFTRKVEAPSFEMIIRRKDETICSVAASSTRLGEQESNITVLVLRDLSEQQRTERERFQHKITKQVIQAQEDERKRISRDLHDSIGQALYSILIGLRVFEQYGLDDHRKNHLQEVQTATVRALEEVKNMALELRPSALDDLGLIPAIRSYLRRFEQTYGIPTELKIQGKKRRYPCSIETSLYRICQEALTNIVKYANANQVTVSVCDMDDEIMMKIIDDGIGFNYNSIIQTTGGLGLYGMKERAQLLEGKVDIQTAPEQGTVICVQIPIKKEDENT